MNAQVELRRARHRAGLSQRALATRAGTSQATLAAYEAGRKQPSVATFQRLLRAAGSDLVARPLPGGLNGPDPALAGDRLVEVLGLAELLPFRRARRLTYPRLPQHS